MSMEAGSKELCIGTGGEISDKHRCIIPFSCFSIGINKPNPWHAISVGVDEVVCLLPPLMSNRTGMAAMRRMRHKDPTSEQLCLASHNESLWVLVTDLEMLRFEISGFLSFVKANGLRQVDPEFNTIEASTMSSTNPKHVMRCAENFVIAPLLHTNDVDTMGLDLFVKVK
jgi:hypothetical protein